MSDIIQLPYAEQWERHHWRLEIEDGRVHLHCLDPCETFECTPECERNKTPEVISVGLTFNQVADLGACTCGQYAKFREAFDAAEGRICACMSTAEEADLLTGCLNVAIEFVDDSTPSGPWGPAEYSHYLVVKEKP